MPKVVNSTAAPAAKVVKLDAGQSLAKSTSSKSKTKSSNGGKRKSQAEDSMEQDGDEDSDSEMDFVNVDLDFFGFIGTDYQATKNLLTQLLSHDAKDLDMAGLTNHIIELEDDVGTTVKSEGEDGDPLAFVFVLPWNSTESHLVSLRTYLLEKTASSASLQRTLQDPHNKIGIVFQERLVNMPPQVVPPLLRVFGEEMGKAGELYDFTHLLFISRVFLATSEDFPEDESSLTEPAKKKKKNKAGRVGQQSEASQTFLYHLEDEILSDVAGQGYWAEYAFTNAPVRGTMGPGEDFGVEQRGRVALIERSKLNEVADKVEKLLG